MAAMADIKRYLKADGMDYGGILALRHGLPSAINNTGSKYLQLHRGLCSLNCNFNISTKRGCGTGTYAKRGSYRLWFAVK